MSLVLAPVDQALPGAAARAAAHGAWDALVRALPDATWVVEVATQRVVAVNDAACRLLARERGRILVEPADRLLATPEDQAYWIEAAAGPPPLLVSDTLLRDAHGAVVQVRRSIAPMIGSGDEPVTHCVVVLFDLSEQRRAEEALEVSVAELQATLESTADGILVTDLAGRIRACNRRFAQLWAMPEDLLAERRDDAVRDWMRRSVIDAEAYQQRLDEVQEAALLSATDRLTLHSGQVIERVSRPLWSRGRPLGRVFSFRDLTDRLAADQRVEALAGTDALTGLANRRRLAERIEQAVQTMQHDGDGFALLLVDLDRFRRINDSLGHDRGDQILRDTTERLQRCVRNGDDVARVGGDQFALLVRHADAEAAEATARRVLDVVALPWQVEGAPFTLTCSVGIALAPAHGRSADELIRHAEGAMRVAKEAGSNGLRFHQARAGFDLRQHMRLDHAMRQALASGRFRLHFQPQVEIATGHVVGAEALIRWRDPALGEVPPGRFIAVAEDTGFIVAIGDWVLEQAVRQAARWQARALDVTLAINVSALQFRQPQFVERVADALRRHDVAPRRLELELTESVLVHDAPEALQRLQALARLGVQLSIDDFGTGYSSLAYLKRFPLGKLKIDRSFVDGLPGDETDAGIVRAIVQMAHALDLAVIAEGVESEPQRRFLAEIGCEQFQGFLYSPALDAMSFENRVRSSLPAGRPDPGPRIRRVQ